MSESPSDQDLAAQLTLFQRRNPYEPPVVWLLAAFLGSLFLLLPNNVDPDLWGHVRYGWDSIQQGTIHRTTTYSYLAEGQTWINHESLAEWTMGFVAHWGGGPGLMIMKATLAAWTLLLLHLIIRRRTLDSLASCILLVGGAWAMRYYWGTRPQIFSFACFATLLFCLDQAFASWFHYRSSPETDTNTPESRQPHLNWAWLALVPLILATWTNAHGGFVVGLAVVLTVLAGRWLQLYRIEKTLPVSTGIGLFAVAALAVTSTLLTPYGFELWMWIANALGQPRPEILEWGPWDLSPAGVRLIYFVVPMALAFLISRKSKDWLEIALLAVLTWQSIKHMRHAPFLVMAIMAWGAPHLRNACRWLQATVQEHLIPALPQSPTPPATTQPLPTHRWVRGSRLSTVVGLVLCFWFAMLLCLQCSAIRVEHDRYPVDAFRFLKKHHLDGRTMVSFNWAQYAIDALCPPDSQDTRQTAPPETPTAVTFVSNRSEDHRPEANEKQGRPVTQIAVDGRFRTAYPQNLIDWHFDFLIGDSRPRIRDLASGPIDPTRMLQLGAPDLILLERRNAVSVATMEANRQHWIRLYQDPIAEIWGRKSRFDSPDSKDYLPPEMREVIVNRPALWSSWPAHPQ